jgi:hypothetical protein
MNVIGVIKPDETFDPQTFNIMHEPAEVPEIQKLFTIRKKDINVLSSVLPDFIKLYQKDSQGRLKDDYEPLRMAVQLYEQAYALSYWKARHILWGLPSKLSTGTMRMPPWRESTPYLETRTLWTDTAAP